MADNADIRPLLEVKGVAKAFGPRLLFRRVDAALMPGTLSLLAGANGAGKSTLMRVLTRGGCYPCLHRKVGRGEGLGAQD